MNDIDFITGIDAVCDRCGAIITGLNLRNYEKLLLDLRQKNQELRKKVDQVMCAKHVTINLTRQVKLWQRIKMALSILWGRKFVIWNIDIGWIE